MIKLSLFIVFSICFNIALSKIYKALQFEKDVSYNLINSFVGTVLFTFFVVPRECSDIVFFFFMFAVYHFLYTLLILFTDIIFRIFGKIKELIK